MRTNVTKRRASDPSPVSSVLATAALAASLLLAACGGQPAETTSTPEPETPATETPEAVALEPAYPEEVSAEGLTAADEAQHREVGEHTHEDGSTHSHEGEDEHGDDAHDDDHAHDDGHSH